MVRCFSRKLVHNCVMGGYRRFTHREWYDNYEHDNFFLHNREAIVVKPTIVPNGKWIVRPAFLGAFPYVNGSVKTELCVCKSDI